MPHNLNQWCIYLICGYMSLHQLGGNAFIVFCWFVCEQYFFQYNNGFWSTSQNSWEIIHGKIIRMCARSGSPLWSGIHLSIYLFIYYSWIPLSIIGSVCYDFNITHSRINRFWSNFLGRRWCCEQLIIQEFEQPSPDCFTIRWMFSRPSNEALAEISALWVFCSVQFDGV